jgi:A/G-specific adenine glycosylase
MASSKRAAAAARRSPRKRTASTLNTDTLVKKTCPAPAANEEQHNKPVSLELPPSASTDNNSNSQLLQSWLTHNHHSYHLSFLSPSKAYAIRRSLINWYRSNRRKLPWRGDVGPYDGSTAGFGEKKRSNGSGGDIRNFFAGTKSKKDDLKDNLQSHEVSAYGVWVSEIMLQQTRVEAVIPYYLKWMESFPTVESLAMATSEQVNSHWAGLGFYRRARFLHAGAKRIVEEYGGVVPDSVEELMKVMCLLWF